MSAHPTSPMGALRTIADHVHGITNDVIAHVARLARERNAALREIGEAHAVLDKVEVTREHMVDARPLTLAERVLLLASDREGEREAAEDARADAAKLREALVALRQGASAADNVDDLFDDINTALAAAGLEPT